MCKKAQFTLFPQQKKEGKKRSVSHCLHSRPVFVDCSAESMGVIVEMCFRTNTNTSAFLPLALT